jgi:hypothetical protein
MSYEEQCSLFTVPFENQSADCQRVTKNSALNLLFHPAKPPQRPGYDLPLGDPHRISYLWAVVNVEIDMSRLRRDLARIYRDLTPAQIEQASYRALNHTVAKLVKPAQQYTSTKLKMSAAAIKKQLKVDKARPGRMRATLSAATPSMRMRDFSPKQFKKGTKVTITPRQRKLVKHAFIQTVATGTGSTMGVFSRGKYVTGRGFVKGAHGKGTGKGKITQLKTSSVAQKLDDTALLTTLRRKMYNDYPVRLGYLMGRASSLGPSPARF